VESTRSGQNELPLKIITGFKPDNPIRSLYTESLQRAQDGKYDNLLKQMRYYVLHQLATHAVEKFPALNFAECGCWWGHSTHILSRILEAHSGFSGRLHVFDSFEGLSEFKPQDYSEYRSTPAMQERARRNFRSDLERVASGLSGFPFVTLHPGWIPAKFFEVEDQEFSLVTVDVDLYEPIRDAMQFFYPRLRQGGVMYFDDYGYETFPGAKLAVDEFRKTVTPQFFLEMPMGSAFLIK
jgi:hypothetical protein